MENLLQPALTEAPPGYQMTDPGNRPAGIYVHVPFCRRKCPYCDFFSITDMGFVDAWQAALLDEIRMATGFTGPVDTIYFGGGTPSVLGGSRIRTLLEALYQSFDIDGQAEITLEANPGTLAPDQLLQYREAGVNRLNIGVQSFNAVALDFLGRIHSGEEAAATLCRARAAGYENIGLDLIYALPGQTMAHWRQDLEAALDFDPEHLSCYLLTYAPGTPLSAQLHQRKFSPLSESLSREMFLATHDCLTARGYIHYEISNFARTSALKSRHNQKYWSHAPYLGLGPAAHSYAGGSRWWNTASVASYVKAIRAGRAPVAAAEELTPEQKMIEAIYLGLRRAEGIRVAGFERRFGVDFREHFADVLKRCRRAGYLALAEGRCALTREGMLYADAIAADFTQAV